MASCPVQGGIMTVTSSTIENLSLNISQEIRVNAPPETTFAALLEELGPYHEVAADKPLPMKIEPWPGGRWYRDLGDGNGHFWGHVQAIKRPTLLEISGPLFISRPVMSNIQYWLSEADGGTLIKFRHTALGLIQDEDRQVSSGWAYTHERLRSRVEASRSRTASSK